MTSALVAQDAAPAVGPAPTPAQPPAQVAPTAADYEIRRLDSAYDDTNLEYAKQAGALAVEQLIGDLVRFPSSSKRLAILPLERDFDGNYLTLQARNLLTTHGAAAGFTHVLAENSSEWTSLLAEIRRGDRYADTMDPATVQKFGRIQGVQGVIVGRVTGVFLATLRSDAAVRFKEQERKQIQVRVTFQAYEVETGKQLWGGERTGSVWLPYDDSIVVPGSRMDWIKWGGIGLLGLIVLVVIVRFIASASRPR
jgi:hypothetical protein